MTQDVGGSKLVSTVVMVMYSLCCQGNSEGDLLLSLMYDSEHGTLQFEVLEVSHLKKHDVIGSVSEL